MESTYAVICSTKIKVMQVLHESSAATQSTAHSPARLELLPTSTYLARRAIHVPICPIIIPVEHIKENKTQESWDKYKVSNQLINAPRINRVIQRHNPPAMCRSSQT